MIIHYMIYLFCT